jgi:uncharacterized protein YukE
MEINMSQINNQARQLRDQAVSLRSVRASLVTYQDNLRSHWKGVDMRSINGTIENHLGKLTAIAANLDAISASVVKEAKAIRVNEE